MESDCTFRFLINDSIKTLFVSDKVKDLLGYSPEDFLNGKISFKELIHDDDEDIAIELFSKQVIQSNATFNLRLRQKNGRIRCFKGHYIRSLDTTSNHITLQLLLQDAKSLWKSFDDQSISLNFNAMMENSDDYIYFKDRNHVFSGASQTLVSITEHSKHWSELLGKTDYDLFPESYADKYYSLEKKVFSGIASVEEIQETLDKRGKKGWVNNRKYSVQDEQGNIVGLFGIARDITESKIAEEALSQFKYTLDHTLDCIFMFRADNFSFIYVNEGAIKQLGYTKAELLKMTPLDIKPEITLERFMKMVRLLNSDLKHSITFETVLRHKDQHDIPVEIFLQLMKNVGSESRYIAIVRDVTERRKADAELKIAATAFESQQGMVVTDVNGKILRVNKAFSRITGYSDEEVIGNNPRILKSNYHDEQFYAAIWQCIIKTGTYEGEIWNRRKSGEIYPEQLTISSVKDQDGKVTNYVGAFTDISVRKAAENRAGFLANHDHLTGLPNRDLFYDRLSRAISQARRKKEYIALLYLDLDDFKPVNDSYGHAAGDLVLKIVAKRLQACVREMDTVARMGGDEFAVILNEIKDSADACTVAMKVIRNIVEGIKLNENLTCSVGISIGIAIYPDNGAELDKLMNAADRAMYESKGAGKNTYTLSKLHEDTEQSAEPWICLEAIPLLGVQEIDDQHYKIVDLINELNIAIKHAESVERVSQLLEDLISFTDYHFKTEERIMNQCSYPDEVEHKSSHAQLLNEIRYLKETFIQGGELVLLQKLKDWFAIHITSSDKPLAEYVLQHPVK